MESSSSLPYTGAIVSLVQGNELAGKVPSAEVASLREGLAQLVSQSASSTSSAVSVNDIQPSRSGPSRQRSLWGQVLQVTDGQDDETQRGDEPHTSADEMKAGAADNVPSSLKKLELLLSSMEPDVATSLRSGIITMLSEVNKSDETIAADMAELLGFQQLDLVGDLIGQRQELAKSLSNGGQDLASQPMPVLVTLAQNSQSSATALKPAAKPYTPRSQLTVHSAEDLAEQKAQRAAYRRLNKGKGTIEHGIANGHLTLEQMEKLRDQQLAEDASRPLFTSDLASSEKPKYPHVFASGASGNTLSMFGSKYVLPVGTTRKEHKEYEEVTIPPPRALPMRFNERLIPIEEMDVMCRGAFPGYKSLNRLQSVVYPLGYGSNENLLVCAPTGAGKTDVAMLAVLRAISQYAGNLHAQGGRGYGIKLNDFKIIYVAPMKALASEIVRKFSKRLAYLAVKVRELTGDMQMTRQEIAETQMIVTTPEKWDVVTRKPTGEGELASKVRLLIIDEVHLLNEDRGAVIETIVARTLRLVESSQSPIRIVGLSATLPNYVDVADFLRVNRYQGLFYFDSSFRPVPLEQHFIGVRGKAGSPQSRANMDKAMFLKVSELIEDGHQVMVFVHARKETVKTATTIREMCKADGIGDLLLAGREDRDGIVNGFKRDLANSRNKELKELFESGLGIHHAGMLRPDRTLSERMFETGVTKVLCCTSTLAWGVNLPAFAVLIKGTDVYDSSLGKFVDLSILDVLQIFGRAGRPQYEDLGVGYICTPQEKLNHYVDAITSQHPIESKFDKGLVDSLNAECALGTVQSVQDGISWLSYTYLFTRMRRNPMAYGMSNGELVDDPHLGAKRLLLITGAAKRLALCKMMEFEEGTTGKLSVTDLGRIAARYYISWKTIEIFNEKLRPKMTEADVLNVLSQATDFEQIIPRDAEEKELKKMLENAPCEVPGGLETAAGKVNILLQGYISRVFVEDFALASDSAYVAHNTGRIIRALFEIALANKWSSTTSALINMSKAVERRMWPFDHSLAQSNLTPDTMFNLQRWADDVNIADLACMPASEIGQLIHLNERIGAAVRTAASQFPCLSISHRLKPITYDTLRIDVQVRRDFDWNDRIHGVAEAFYIWVEEESGIEIQQWTRVLMRPNMKSTLLSFVLPISEPMPSGVSIRWISDTWLGSEDIIWVSFEEGLIKPAPPPAHLPLLDLPLLPVESALQCLPSEARAEYLSRCTAFNALQSQMLHTVLHTSSDVLLAAPVGSGRSTMAGLAIWRAFLANSAARVLVIVPHPRLLLQAVEQYGALFPIVRLRAVNSAAEIMMEDRSFRKEILLALPTHVLQYTTGYKGALATCRLSRFDVIVAEDLHLMDAVYELVLSRVRQVASTGRLPRVIATSASLYDAGSVADWLGIKELACYSFDTKDRPVPLRITLQSFDVPHSYALLKTMVKPAYDRARATMEEGKASSSAGPCLIFVPSASQCLSTASDLVTRSASDLDHPSGSAFLGCTEEEIEPYLEQLTDARLHELVLHGIGLFHDGLNPRDCSLMLDLYRNGIIRLLVAPREACWSLPVRAGLVVIMSAQYVRLVGDTEGEKGESISERRTTSYAATDLLRMTSLASRQSQGLSGECLILCQTSQVDEINRTVVRAGLPLESRLAEGLEADGEGGEQQTQHLLATTLLSEIWTGRIKDHHDFIDSFTWTFLFQRLLANPTYYNASGSSVEDASSRLSTLVDRIVDVLTRAGLMTQESDRLDCLSSFVLTKLGELLMARQNEGWIAVLLDLYKVASSNPELAAALCQTTTSKGQKQDEETDTDTEPDLLIAQDQLLALRDRTPSEWLTAFGIRRADRRAKKAREAATTAAVAAEEERHLFESDQGKSSIQSISENSSSIKIEELEPLLPQTSLLLCAYFSSTSITDQRMQEVQANLVLEVVGEKRRRRRSRAGRYGQEGRGGKD